MIKAPKNTFKYTVFVTDFGVYLCISLMLSPCLSNLKKSSIFPRIGLNFFQSSSFLNNSILRLLQNCFCAKTFFVFLNTCNGQDNWSLSFVLLKLSFGKIKGTIFIFIRSCSFHSNHFQNLSSFIFFIFYTYNKAYNL